MVTFFLGFGEHKPLREHTQCYHVSALGHFPDLGARNRDVDPSTKNVQQHLRSAGAVHT